VAVFVVLGEFREAEIESVVRRSDELIFVGIDGSLTI